MFCSLPCSVAPVFSAQSAGPLLTQRLRLLKYHSQIVSRRRSARFRASRIHHFDRPSAVPSSRQPVLELTSRLFRPITKPFDTASSGMPFVPTLHVRASSGRLARSQPELTSSEHPAIFAKTNANKAQACLSPSLQKHGEFIFSSRISERGVTELRLCGSESIHVYKNDRKS